MAFIRALQSKRTLRIVGILDALGLAFAAQSLFTGQPFRLSFLDAWSPALHENVGIGLLVAAAACFAAVTFEPDSVESSERPAGVRSIGSVLRAAWTTDFVGPALAASCYLASLGLYLVVGENLWVQLLWLGGIAILLISQRPISTIRSELAPIKWWEWWLVTAITAVGFGLRYWRLTEIPSHVDNDVAVMGSYALDLIHAGQTNWFGMATSDHPVFEHQLLAWSMRLFGESHYGLVMMSVIAGTLTLPALYLLGREMFGWKVGLIAMALLTISYTHIHFSRILFTPKPTLIVTLLVYFIFRGLRTRRGLWFALAGAMLGLALLVYYSGRIGPVMVIAFWAWALLWNRRILVDNLGNWAVFALASLASFGPMLAYAILHFDQYIGRGNTVGLFNPPVMAHSLAKYEVNTVGEVLLEQVKHTFLTFHLYGDQSPLFSFGGPMVSPLTAALLALGLGLALSRLRSLRYFVLVAWVVLTLLLGGVLTADPPFWPHLAITLPAVALLAALAAEKMLAELAPPTRFGYWGLSLLFAAALLFTGIRDWRTYIDYVSDNAGPRTRIARYINSLPAGYQVRLVSDDWSWDEYAFRFFDQGVPGKSVAADQLRFEPPDSDRPTVFILFQHPELAPILQTKFPGGVIQEHLNNTDHVAFLSYNFIPVGYTFSSVRVASPGIWSLPGWWLIGSLLVGWMLVLIHSFSHRHSKHACVGA